MRDRLVRTGDAADIAAGYGDIHATFRALPIAGPLWSSLDGTLVRPSGRETAYRQTVPAQDVFTLDMLRQAGANMRAMRTHASTLVGVGLLLTFIGLVLALKSAGGTLAARDPREVQAGLRALLDAAGAKFAFSVLGLLLSLLFGAWVRALTRRTEAALSGFLEAIDRRMPRLTAQEVAVGTQMLLRDGAISQHQALERLAEGLAGRFDSALVGHLDRALAPLVAAIAAMSSGVGEANRRAIEQMADRFAERLEGAMGAEIRAATVGMERVGGHVNALADSLATVRGDFEGSGKVVARDMAKAASDAARGIADAAESTRAALAAAGTGWQGSAEQVAQVLRACLDDAISALAASVGRGGDHIEEGGKKLAERLTRAAADAGREIRAAGAAIGTATSPAGAALADAGKRLADDVAAAGGALDASARQFARMLESLDVPTSRLGAALGAADATVGASADRVALAAERLLSEAGGAAALLRELRDVAARLEAAAVVQQPDKAPGG